VRFSHKIHPAKDVPDKLPIIMEEACLQDEMATSTEFNEILSLSNFPHWILLEGRAQC
jgi:hypothetical protein